MLMHEDLEQLLRVNRHTARRGNCANEAQLAAYVDGRLEQKARVRLEAHLADCEPCLAQVSFLVREAESANAAEVPPHLLAKAKKLVVTRRKRTFSFDWRWTTATVAAGLLIMTLVVIGLRLRTTGETQLANANRIARQPSTSPDAAQSEVKPRSPELIAQAIPPATAKPSLRKPESSTPVVRGAQTPSGGPKLLFPRDGALVKRDSLTFRWLPVPDVDFYEVSLMNASGDVLISRRVEGETINLPRDFNLQPGTKYFVSIRAHLRDGKTMRSNVLSFRVVN